MGQGLVMWGCIAVSGPATLLSRSCLVRGRGGGSSSLFVLMGVPQHPSGRGSWHGQACACRTWCGGGGAGGELIWVEQETQEAPSLKLAAPIGHSPLDHLAPAPLSRPLS